MKKYIVMGGEVFSKNDWDWHYIDSNTLCQLYGLNPRDCYLCESSNPRSTRGLPIGLPILGPRCDGNYVLESEKVFVH